MFDVLCSMYYVSMSLTLVLNSNRHCGKDGSTYDFSKLKVRFDPFKYIVLSSADDQHWRFPQ